MDNGSCPICLVSIPASSLLEHIVNAHATTKTQKCEQCSKEFELKLDLENHIKEKHSQPEIEEIPPDSSSKENQIPDFQCHNCQVAFLTKKALLMHINTSKCGTTINSIKHKCHNCSKSFTTFGGLRLHKKKCERKNPVSKQIKKAVKTAGIDKDKEGPSKLNCPVCGLKFKSEIQLQKHLTTHYNPKFLGSIFKNEPSKPKVETSGSQNVSISNQDQVSQKENEGSNDELFQCPECEESFSNLDNIKIHFKKSHKLTAKQLGATNLDTYLNKPLKVKSPIEPSKPKIGPKSAYKPLKAKSQIKPSKPKIGPKSAYKPLKAKSQIKPSKPKIEPRSDEEDKPSKANSQIEPSKPKIEPKPDEDEEDKSLKAKSLMEPLKPKIEPKSDEDEDKPLKAKSRIEPSKPEIGPKSKEFEDRPSKAKSPIEPSKPKIGPKSKNIEDKPLKANSPIELLKPKIEPEDEDEIEVVTEVKQVKCDQCDKSFKYRRILENHKIKVHDNRTTFPCSDCDKVFEREIYLQSHRSYFHEVSVKEDIDFQPFYNLSDSEDIVSVTFRCLSCPFSTEDDSEMISHHLETHLTIDE